MILSVKELKSFSIEFLEEHYFRLINASGVYGAYVMGGLASKEDQDEFETKFRDIDIALVVDRNVISIDKDNYPHGKFIFYKNILFQVIFIDKEEFTENLLTMLGLGSNLRYCMILYDKEEFVKNASNKVVAEWAKKKMLSIRVKRSWQHIMDFRDSYENDWNDWKKLVYFFNLISMISGHIAIATLNTPTHRRTLALSYEILEKHNRIEFQELMLEIIGVTNFTESDLSEFINKTLQYLKKSLTDKLQQLGFVDGSLDPQVNLMYINSFRDSVMDIAIDNLHREAIIPILSALEILSEIIEAVGTNLEKEGFDSFRNYIHTKLGMISWEQKITLLDDLLNEIGGFTEELVEIYGK